MCVYIYIIILNHYYGINYLSFHHMPTHLSHIFSCFFFRTKKSKVLLVKLRLFVFLCSVFDQFSVSRTSEQTKIAII